VAARVAPRAVGPPGAPHRAVVVEQHVLLVLAALDGLRAADEPPRAVVLHVRLALAQQQRRVGRRGCCSGSGVVCRGGRACVCQGVCGGVFSFGGGVRQLLACAKGVHATFVNSVHTCRDSTHTHTHTRTRARARARARTHAQAHAHAHSRSPSLPYLASTSALLVLLSASFLDLNWLYITSASDGSAWGCVCVCVCVWWAWRGQCCVRVWCVEGEVCVRARACVRTCMCRCSCDTAVEEIASTSAPTAPLLRAAPPCFAALTHTHLHMRGAALLCCRHAVQVERLPGRVLAARAHKVVAEERLLVRGLSSGVGRFVCVCGGGGRVVCACEVFRSAWRARAARRPCMHTCTPRAPIKQRAAACLQAAAARSTPPAPPRPAPPHTRTHAPTRTLLGLGSSRMERLLGS
jgi:hypothetical protein